MSPLRAINSGILISIMKCDEVLSPNPEDNSFPYSRSGISREERRKKKALVFKTKQAITTKTKLPAAILHHREHKQDTAHSQERHRAVRGLWAQCCWH